MDKELTRLIRPAADGAPLEIGVLEIVWMPEARSWVMRRSCTR